MLVYQNRISVGVHHHEMGGTTRALVGFRHERDSARFEASLQLSDVGESLDRLCVLVPARIEGEQVLLEHALEQTDHRVTVLENQPAIRRVARKRREAELLVELP